MDIIHELTDQYKDKKILVMGLGVQGGGVGVARFFAKLGCRVKVTDLKTESDLQSSIDALEQFTISYTLGRHDSDDFLEADVIFKGPSIRWDNPFILEALKNGKEIEMESSFFASHCKGMMVGITGTRGKSTTTALIFESAKLTKRNVYLAGNIPQKPTIELLEKVTKDDIVIMELSSWQLSGFHKKKISPHIAVFTNFYPDHLNYYKDMDEYFYDKSAIYLYQKSEDILIVNESLKERINEAHVPSKISYFNSQTYTHLLSLLGEHNRENAAAAFLVAQKLNISEDSVVTLFSHFQGLAYRLQKIATINGINVYNDTTSTTPTACIKAIESFPSKKITLIFGGNSKKLPYDDLIISLEKVSKIVLLEGDYTTLLFSYFNKNKVIGGPFASLKEAFECAINGSNSEDVILFSPGATSFAQFKNEFDRGNQFNEVVKQYEENTK